MDEIIAERVSEKEVEIRAEVDESMRHIRERQVFLSNLLEKENLSDSCSRHKSSYVLLSPATIPLR